MVEGAVDAVVEVVVEGVVVLVVLVAASGDVVEVASPATVVEVVEVSRPPTPTRARRPMATAATRRPRSETAEVGSGRATAVAGTNDRANASRGVLGVGGGVHLRLAGAGELLVQPPPGCQHFGVGGVTRLPCPVRSRSHRGVDPRCRAVDAVRDWRVAQPGGATADTDTRRKGRGVPLSEDDERILQEIERQLYASDPQLVREVSSTTVYQHASRNLKYAGLGFIAGFVLMLATFTTSVILGGIGVLVMLASAVFFERNARRVGKAGLRQLTDSVNAGGLRDSLGGAGQRMRDRMRRDDPEQ